MVLRHLHELAKRLSPEEEIHVSTGTYMRCPDPRDGLVSNHLISSLAGTWAFLVPRGTLREKLPDMSRGRRLDIGYWSREVAEFPSGRPMVWSHSTGTWENLGRKAVPSRVLPLGKVWGHLNKALLALPAGMVGVKIYWKAQREGSYSVGLEALSAVDGETAGLPGWLG